MVPARSERGEQLGHGSRPQIVDVGIIGACRPEGSDEICSQCGACQDVCRENAISLQDALPSVDDSKCLCCGQCIAVCPTGTLQESARGYRILVGGKLGRHPRLATELSGVYELEDVLRVVDRWVDHYQRYCLQGERFGEILERTGMPVRHLPARALQWQVGRSGSGKACGSELEGAPGRSKKKCDP